MTNPTWTSKGCKNDGLLEIILWFWAIILHALLGGPGTDPETVVQGKIQKQFQNRCPGTLRVQVLRYKVSTQNHKYGFSCTNSKNPTFSRCFQGESFGNLHPESSDRQCLRRRRAPVCDGPRTPPVQTPSWLTSELLLHVKIVNSILQKRYRHPKRLRSPTTKEEKGSTVVIRTK